MKASMQGDTSIAMLLLNKKANTNAVDEVSEYMCGT